MHIGAVLVEAVEACAHLDRKKEVRIEVDCAAELQAVVNPSLLQQAIINLLDNAIKYSETGAVVHLAAGHAGNEVFVRVQDHGQGIAREHLPRLFERFYRVDKARSRDLGGTGLGLAIVKHIADLHGGRVEVESRPGEGSVFSVFMPGPVDSLTDS